MNMKSKTFFAALMCCLSLVFATEASANSWRVNPDQRAGADFLDFNAAMADERVVDGDILYMDKGSTIATQQTISKKVTIVGPGYFIGENDADEAYLSNVVNLTANGIKITGLHTSSLILAASDIVIERCRVTGNIVANSSDATNCSIRSSIIVGGQATGGAAFGWEIVNNIFYKNVNDTNYASCPIYSFSNALIDHNIIIYYNSWGAYSINEITNSTITNNIILNSSSNYGIANNSLSSNNIISHNVLNTSGYSDYPNNKYNTTISFVGTPSTNQRDESYQLPEDSPAKGYAEDGSDCGPFAGAYPYVLCGYPLYVPRFESITVPSQPNEEGKLIINMKIVNQNQ